MGINISIVGESFKLWKSKAIDYILAKRFCDKHMREFIKKHNITDSGISVVALLGNCEKCTRLGIVYYLEGYKGVS